jgi:hypothetical protein
MMRLERMAQGQSWEVAGEGLGEILDEPEPVTHPAVVFGLGAFAGMLVAGAAFLGVARFELQWPAAHGPRLPDARSAAAPTAPPPVRIASAAKAPAVFDVAIDRRHAAHAPFGLQLSGSGAADLEVVLSNVPPTAHLSRGERRGASTWSLKAADLGDLHLVLHDGTPEAFDVRIDVMAPPGMAVTPSVAKVRLVGPPPAAAPSAKTAAAGIIAPELPAPPPVQAAAGTGAVEKAARPPRRTPPPLVTDAGATRKQGAGDARPAPPPWTEAPSALGATSRSEWGRQVWWQLPLPIWPPILDSPPAWSPFLDLPAHR